MSSIIVEVLSCEKTPNILAVVWIILIAASLNGCIHLKERSTSKMENLNIPVLRDRNISINPVQYRNIFEKDLTHEEEWKLLIFAEEVGIKKGDIVLVSQNFYYVDGDTLIHICEVSNQQTTNDRIIPYLQSKIDRATLLK